MHRSVVFVGTLAVIMVIAAGCTGSSPSLPDTQELRAEKAIELARMAVEGGGLDATLDRGADLAYEAVADDLAVEIGRDVTPDETQKVRAVLRDALAEVLAVDAWSEAVAGYALADRGDRWIGSLLGGVVGAAAGHAAEKGARKKKGWELIIRLDTGEEVGIDVPSRKETFELGDRVRLQTGGGRTKVSKV